MHSQFSRSVLCGTPSARAGPPTQIYDVTKREWWDGTKCKKRPNSPPASTKLNLYPVSRKSLYLYHIQPPDPHGETLKTCKLLADTRKLQIDWRLAVTAGLTSITLEPALHDTEKHRPEVICVDAHKKRVCSFLGLYPDQTPYFGHAAAYFGLQVQFQIFIY